MRIKLKFFVLGFLIATVLSFSLTSFADSMTIIKVFRNSVKIYLNNVQMTGDSFSFEGHTYVKLREVCEKLNKDISYDERTKTVFINNYSLVGDSIPDNDNVPIPIPVQIPVPKVITNDNPIKSGMYKVGSDIKAGEYILFGSAMSYYQITKDSSGTLESIISNDNFNSTRYITLKDGQYVEFRGAKMLTIEKAPIINPIDGKYSEGMYKVGRDIKAGEYKAVPDGGGSYIEVSKNSNGTLNSIITNDIFEAEKYITIKNGQYIKLIGCYIQQNNINTTTIQINDPFINTPIEEKNNTTTPDTESADKKEIIVYITNSGTKYHINGCQYLNKSKIPINLNDAKAQDYTPCSKCQPQIPAQIPAQIPVPIPVPKVSNLYIDKTNVTSSGDYRDRTADRAFDGIYNQHYFYDSWQASSFLKPQWISCEFEIPVVVTKYAICSSSYHDSTPNKWLFQGRNNNGDWITLDTINKQSKWIASQKCTFDINNITAYKYYRIYVTDVQGTYDYPVIIGEIEMYGY